MTHDDAVAKAARLTAGGVPTVAVKNTLRGGYQTKTVAPQRAAEARYKLGDVGGNCRLNRQGERFREQDYHEVMTEVGHACFCCRRLFAEIPKDARGRTPVRIDHDRANGFVRAPLCDFDNRIESNLRAMGITEFDDVMTWALRMATLMQMPWLSMSEDEIRRAKRRAKQRTSTSSGASRRRATK